MNALAGQSQWQWIWQPAIWILPRLLFFCQPPTSPSSSKSPEPLLQELNLETVSALHAPLVNAWHFCGEKAFREHWSEGKAWWLRKEENQWALQRWGAGTYVCQSFPTTKGQCRKRELSDSQSAENRTLQAASAAPTESKLSVLLFLWDICTVSQVHRLVLHLCLAHTCLHTDR